MDPVLYKKNSNFQRRDAAQCLQIFGGRINWNRAACVIDLGSGDGYVTSNLLQKYLPQDFRTLVGIDISKEMVQHANEHYSNDRISFTLMDIAGELPKQFVCAFHHAFSFYSIHWIHDQEKAFENIYYMLTVNGTVLAMFMGSSPVYEVWRVLVKMNKWAKWAKCIEKCIVRYHDLKEPGREVKRIMSEAGFRNIHVDCSESPYVYRDLDELKRFAQTLNPFKLSGDLLEEFGDDFVEICVKLSLVEPVEDHYPAVNMSNMRIVAFGSKLDF